MAHFSLKVLGSFLLDLCPVDIKEYQKINTDIHLNFLSQVKSLFMNKSGTPPCFGKWMVEMKSTQDICLMG